MPPTGLTYLFTLLLIDISHTVRMPLRYLIKVLFFVCVKTSINLHALLLWSNHMHKHIFLRSVLSINRLSYFTYIPYCLQARVHFRYQSYKHNTVFSIPAPTFLFPSLYVYVPTFIYSTVPFYSYIFPLVLFSHFRERKDFFSLYPFKITFISVLILFNILQNQTTFFFPIIIRCTVFRE